MPRTSIEQAQIDAFKGEVVRIGFSPDSFTFAIDQKIVRPNDVRYVVQVSRENHSKEYELPSDWLRPALLDLYCGGFGAPRDAEIRNEPHPIQGGVFDGLWMAYAYLRLPDEGPLRFDGQPRLFETEQEAKRAGRDWVVSKILKSAP